LSGKQTSKTPLINKSKEICNKSDDQQSNKIRTKLLLLAFKDLKDQKENSQTKINSLTIKEAEKEYIKQNDCSVNLKPEMTFSSSKKGVYHVKSQENLNPISNEYSNLSSNYLKADYKHISSSISITHSPIYNKQKLQNKYYLHKKNTNSKNSIQSIKFSSSSLSSNDNYSSSNNSSQFNYLVPLKRKTSFAKKKLEYFTQNLLSSYEDKNIKSTSNNCAEKECDRYNCNNSGVITIKEESPIKFDINQSYVSEHGLSEKNKKRAHEGFMYLQKLTKNLIIRKKKKRNSKFSDLEKDELVNVNKNDLFSQLSYELTNDTSFSTSTQKNSDVKENLTTYNNISEAQNFNVFINGLRPISEEEDKTKNSNYKFEKSKTMNDSNKQSKKRIVKKENVGFQSNVDLHLELLRELESQSQKIFKISPSSNLIKISKNCDHKNEFKDVSISPNNRHLSFNCNQFLNYPRSKEKFSIKLNSCSKK
jgi:hypothetical protein